jgi:putative endonuclease
LDIIAQQNDELVIVEVKTRRNTLFGTPETAIDNRKIRRILSSTNTYLQKYGIDMNVRFDIITVTGSQKPFHIEHIENAFYPPIW